MFKKNNPIETIIGHTRWALPKISHLASIRRSMELTTPGPGNPAQNIEMPENAIKQETKQYTLQ